MTHRLLVVDDDEKSRRLARDVLEHAGYDISVAISGEDALRQAASIRFSLVLLDIGLPGIGGLQTFKVLRTFPGYESVPVIAMTASVMPHERRTLLAEGFDAFVSKPLSIKELVRLVAATLAASHG